MDPKFQYTNLKQSTANNDLTSTISTTYNYKFTTHKQIFIQQWNNVSGFFFFCVVHLVLQIKLKIRKYLNKNWTWKPNLDQRDKESKDTYIRLERKNPVTSTRLERELNQVVHQIQKTLKPTKHKSLAVGWNFNESLMRKFREREIG